VYGKAAWRWAGVAVVNSFVSIRDLSKPLMGVAGTGYYGGLRRCAIEIRLPIDTNNVVTFRYIRCWWFSNRPPPPRRRRTPRPRRGERRWV